MVHTHMATDIEFSFQRLTRSAQRHIRVFQIHQFLDRFAMGLTVAVVALALTDRGMDIFQIYSESRKTRDLMG